MNCPYCKKHIPGMTGLQEADNFRKHLQRCGKSPGKILAKKLEQSSGRPTVYSYDLKDALEIRAASGQ